MKLPLIIFILFIFSVTAYPQEVNQDVQIIANSEYCKDSPFPSICLPVAHGEATSSLCFLINCNNISSIRSGFLESLEINGEGPPGRVLENVRVAPAPVNSIVEGIRIKELAYFAEPNKDFVWKRFNGELNKDSLMNLTLELNPSKKTLTLVREKKVLLNRKYMAPCVNIQIGGKQFKFLIDFRMKCGVKISSTTLNILEKISPETISPVSEQGSTKETNKCRLNSLTIGPVKFDYLNAEIGGGDNRIGPLALNRFETKINFGTGEVELQPRSIQKYFDHSFYDGMSFRSVKSGNEPTYLMVSSIAVPSIAEESGILTGDYLVNVGTTSLSPLTEKNIEEALHKLLNIRSNPLTLTVIRNNQLIHVELLGGEF